MLGLISHYGLIFVMTFMLIGIEVEVRFSVNIGRVLALFHNNSYKTIVKPSLSVWFRKK